MTTKEIIISKAKELYSQNVVFSMRQLANSCGIGISVLYYYFKDKDELLKIAFDSTNTNLGVKRRQLSQSIPAEKMLAQRIDFQLEHAEDIMFILKYYLAYRKTFQKNPTGYIPEKGYLHIHEVLEEGVRQKKFKINNIEQDAKVITHAINGFILEYYPDIPIGKKRQELVDMICSFVLRALSNSLKSNNAYGKK